jgi:hypothetical protein
LLALVVVEGGEERVLGFALCPRGAGEVTLAGRREGDDVAPAVGRVALLEIEAVTDAAHRKLDMTWSPLGILRAPSRLVVRARLVRAEGTQR